MPTQSESQHGDREDQLMDEARGGREDGAADSEAKAHSDGGRGAVPAGTMISAWPTGNTQQVACAAAALSIAAQPLPSCSGPDGQSAWPAEISTDGAGTWP